jgi:hypothetical protein
VTRIKYVAEISGVREVSLRCTADRRWWDEELAIVGLEVVEREGRAEIMLSATDARFRGVKFREFSISVLAREIDGRGDGWYLAHAFNSSRFFAFVERAWFSTPYFHGQITVNALAPAEVDIRAESGSLRATMAQDGGARTPVRQGRETWRGPIFLPPRNGKLSGLRKLFYAKLDGNAQAFPFLQGKDEILIARSAPWPIFGQLADANLTGGEWLLRHSATHAKSRTYAGPALVIVD